MSHPFAWLRRIVDGPALQVLVEKVRAYPRVVAEGSAGSSTTILAGALATRLNRPVLLVVAHLDDADDAYEDLDLFNAAGYQLPHDRFGALEILPGESNVSLELLAERLAVVENLLSSPAKIADQKAKVLIASIQALMQPVPQPSALGDFSLTIQPGQRLPPGQLLDWLDRSGYSRADAIDQPGDFTLRGGIIDIYLPSAGGTTLGSNQPLPVRIDYFGDEIDSLSIIDTDTLASGRKLDRIQLIGTSVARLQNEDRTTSLLELLPPATLIVLHEIMELAEQARGYYERLTNAKGIIAPNATLKALIQRQHVEVNQFGSAADSNALVHLPIRPLLSFAPDAAQAVQELAELAFPPLPPGEAGKRSEPGEGAADMPAADLPKKADEQGGRGERMPEVLPPLSLHKDGRANVACTLTPALSRGERGSDLVVLCEKEAERTRLAELIHEHAPQAEQRIPLEIGYLHRGFIWGEISQVQAREIFLIPHHELFHRYLTRRRIRRISVGAERAADAFFDLAPGDYVVHEDHGIARFVGLRSLRKDGVIQDFVTLEFAQKSLLHLPLTQVDLLQKYIGGFEGKPPLSLLGGKRWAKQKQEVEQAVKDVAAQMLSIQATRASLPGIRFPADTAWQKEFEAEFPYEETEDQLAAIAEVKKNMADDQPMDRLICGDVGFGKTEVAIRAAFKAVEAGKQVVVLVPTTVLAEQHEQTFRGRLADYPFSVASLSRFKTAAEQTQTLNALAQGKLDIVIGTHRLLSEDVRCHDLGLVIIDEEQRFGVEHKHKLLKFRLTADVLTLTATPIPRTLHLALLGLRDISSLATSPADRRAIVTEVLPYEKERVRRAIMRELNRDGQIYFVHNRVHNIQAVADEVQQLAPKARVLIGHGQMAGHELEEVMLKFIRHEADILVCTTIIESGIDIPTANTIFINEADNYGLADLHQLRGRVGRWKHRAYCYLLLPEDHTLTEKAAKRLKAIEQYSMLGAGFKIAMRDLEIRGAGNILGKEQSGHLAAVGYEMYCKLLEQETRRMRQEKIVQPVRTHLELGISGRIPPDYIPSDKYRMEAYRRLSRATTFAELEDLAKSLSDAYGKLPPAARHLLDLTELRLAASLLEIETIKIDGPDLIFRTSQPQRLDAILKNVPGRASLIDPKTIYYRPPTGYLAPPATLLAVLRTMLVQPVRSQG